MSKQIFGDKAHQISPIDDNEKFHRLWTAYDNAQSYEPLENPVKKLIVINSNKSNISNTIQSRIDDIVFENIPSPNEIRSKLPLNVRALNSVLIGRRTLKSILDRKDHVLS